MKIEIRRVGTGDEPLFERVANDVFDCAIEKARLTEYLTQPGHHLIVALCDGEIVGQCAAVVHRHPDAKGTELYIDEVGVAPAFQRRGIAERMLEEMLAWGKSLGCQEAWVGTEPDNLPARALYASRSATAEAFVMYVIDL
ncbi:MAG TPA: GNAT family N-acetyltransferase [Hyphomicrobiaceae bacterium]|nr:GNAT family N-acetyltransferase [Hyphomicrobiaceae bacterium]